MKYWTETLSGNKIDLENLESYDFPIEDIAHSLSMNCRFNGHTPKFYSVAQHSLFVSDTLREIDRLQFLGLVHDFHEHVVSDIPNPVKQYMKNVMGFDIGVLEDKIDAAFFNKIGIKPPTEDEKKTIKLYDMLALKVEKDFLIQSDTDWPYLNSYIGNIDIESFRPTFNWTLELSKEKAREIIVNQYNYLYNKLKR